MQPPRFLLAIAGYRPDELTGFPYAATHRRMWLGLLAVGSALIGATLFGIAISRIDPSHHWRAAFGLVAGGLYFCMLLAFDALFVVGTRRPRPSMVIARVVLSLLVTAFSSITMDAVIAGDRLDAEIDDRRIEADLAAKAKHANVHDVPGRQAEAKDASHTTESLRQRLNQDPETSEFSQAVKRATAAETAKAMAARELEPRALRVRSQIAGLQAQADAHQSPVNPALLARLSEMRASLDVLVRRIREIETEHQQASRAVQRLRDDWRNSIQEQLKKAEARQEQAMDRLATARAEMERGQERSRGIHDRAFQANVVEQTSAYWALASRDRAYMILGVVVWLVCLCLEMMAVLVKIQLAPDEPEYQRAHDLSMREARNASLLSHFEGAGAQLAVQREEARQALLAAAEELREVAKLHQIASQAVVDAWLREQATKRAHMEPSLHATLDMQLDALQASLTRQLQLTFARLGHGGDVGPGPAAAGAGMDPGVIL